MVGGSNPSAPNARKALVFKAQTVFGNSVLIRICVHSFCEHGKNGIIMQKNCISGILRQKRKPGANGACRDTARCIIKVNGKREYHYLGLYGSPEAEAEYQRLKSSLEPQAVDNRGLTSDALFDSYTATFLLGDKLSRDLLHDRDVISFVKERFPPFYLSDFSMSFLVAFQNFLIQIAPEVRYAVNNDGKHFVKKRPWTRSYVNRLMKHFKRILAWGVNNGFLSPMFRESIRLFPGITSANPRGLSDRPRRDSVSDSDVLATLPYLTPIVADMVKIQRSACLRPSEVCDLRVGDIVFSDSGIATVERVKNKIARTGVHRQFAFGLAEQKILRKYCEGRESQDYVFRLREHVDFIVESSRRNHEKEIDKKYLDRYGVCFNSELYSKIIARAVKRAMKDNPDVTYWTPYQLRHAAYSAISAQYGYDVASKVAGHLSPCLARVYDHSAAVVSQRIAAERQKGWWE